MSHQLRAPIVFAPALVLISFLTAAGQTNSNLDRTLSANTSSVDRRGRTRTRTAQLPFEQSVIIYYKGPGKTSTQSNPAAVPTSRANAATGKGEDSTKELTSNSRSLAGQPSKTSLESRRSDTVADLQPVIIYYRTYSPAAILRGSEQRPIVPNEKQAAASSIRNNVSAANPRKPTDVTRRAKNEIPTGNSIADLDETLSTDPKQPLTEPIMNSISPADSGLAVNPPEIETANLIVEKTVKKPVAPSIGVAGTIPLQNADSTEQNSADGAVVSNVPPTSPSSTLPEEPATAVSTVVETAKLNSDSLPAGTSAGFETESGSVDAVGLNNSAVRLTLENQHGEAIVLLERAIEANPTVAKFHRNLSIVFERMKEFDKALASARTAEKLAPADPSVLEQLCELELITANTTAALGCYEKLKSMGPLDALTQTYYGLALFRSGKQDESIKVLEQAARSTPAIAETMNVLGIVYYKRKQFDNAITVLKNAVETAPDVFEIRYNLALAQLARGNKAAAISQYNIIKTGDRKLADQLYRVLQGDKVVSVSDMMRSKR